MLGYFPFFFGGGGLINSNQLFDMNDIRVSTMYAIGICTMCAIVKFYTCLKITLKFTKTKSRVI